MTSPRQEFARLLWCLADLDQANSPRRSFRARAYRRAVWALDQLSPGLTETTEQILAVPGIGTGIARLIEEFRAQGQLRSLDALRARLPLEAATLARLRGMTPKRLHALKKDLRVETVADFRQALERGRVESISGVGAKTAEFWSRTLGEQDQGVPIYRALEFGDMLVNLLETHLPGLKVRVAGAVRRLEAWIDEIELETSDAGTAADFLATSAAVAALPLKVRVHEFVETPMVEGVVAAGDLLGDLHCHTDWSPDGGQSLEQLVAAATALGYEYIGVTDHAVGLRFGGLDIDRVRAQRSEIERVQAKYPKIKILHGMELNIDRDGSVDFEQELLAWLDYTVAGAHSHLSLSEDEQTSRMLVAVGNPEIDIIAHPTGRRIGFRPPIDVDLSAVFATARENGTALEVNGHLDRLDLSAELISIAQRAGVKFAANSDAHRTTELGNVHHSLTLLQNAGIARESVINCASPGRWK